MGRQVTIAIDAMGGDIGPAVTVAGALDVWRINPDLVLIFVGDETAIRTELARLKMPANDRIRVRHTSQVVGMDESPSKALRSKRDSSLRVAIDLVRDDAADAIVSAGNTGALMVFSWMVLKMIPHIDRPAIITRMPTLSGWTYMLDLGANADCSEEHLYQFAVMGSALVQQAHGIDRPTVALLNIGSEEVKGIEKVKKAAQLLRQSDLNYVGYIEGNQIFSGHVNVVVCDGFVGNVSLKTSEGVAKLLGSFIKAAFSKSWYGKLAALISYPVLSRLRAQMDPREYNGATLVGLQGIVVKSHGGTDILGFANAVKVAVLEVEHALPKRIEDQIVAAMAGFNSDIKTNDHLDTEVTES